MKFLLLLELLYLCHGALGQHHPTRRKVTLYGEDDPLVILNSDTFDAAMQESSAAWIVQFYNSWCGHCINYAPHWKLFASQVKGWSHFMKVGVLDCSTEENTKICRDYQITSTPTIRLFPSNTVEGFLGFSTQARNISDVTQAVIDFLTTQQAEGKGSASWPNLQSYIGSTDNLWEDFGNSQLDKVAIVIEPNTSYIGRAALLDLAIYRPEVYILSMLGDEEHISLLLKERIMNNDNSYRIKTTVLEPGSWISRESLVDMIKEKFSLMDVTTTVSPSTTVKDDTGLYSANDPLIILNNDTFDAALQGSSAAWIVQFYNSWCGHCINYAPHWKLFASQVKGWTHFVKVGVLDCSTEDNTKLCRDYQITGTPTVRLFPPNTVQGFLGYTTKARDVSDVTQAVIEFLTTQQAEGKGSASWPNLQIYIGSTDNIWEDIGNSQLDKVAIVVEPNTSYIGRSAVLDLAVYRPEVSILTMLGEDDHLSVLFKERKKKSDNSYYIKTTALEPGSWITREKLVDLIKEKFNIMEVTTTVSPSPSIIGLDENNDLNQETVLDISNFPKDQVYMVDIENTIAYALRNEIAQRSQFNITEQMVLIDFLQVLVQHLPLRSVVSNFLKKLHEYILQQDDTIGGYELEQAFLSLSSAESSELPSVHGWLGCRGSLPQYRGYPCGLWTTFHTITANVTDQKAAEQVLPAIHGFVKYFFGCRECSKHFQSMYASDGGAEMKMPDDVLLWLWRAHNKVNNRIKGDESEDPEHPKVIYPTKEMCADCSVSGHYNNAQVMSYLRNIYGKDQITLIGTQDVPNGIPKSKEHTSGHRGRQRKKDNARRRRGRKGGKKRSRKRGNETAIEAKRKGRKGTNSLKAGYIDDGNKETKKRKNKRRNNKMNKKKNRRQAKKRYGQRNNSIRHIYI